MARPGFTIPNAADSPKSYLIAEPDAGDFDVLAHHRYGIYLGCDYVLNGNSFSLTSPVNVFSIKGDLYVVRNEATSLTIEGSAIVGTDSRFDLIGYRLMSGTPKLHLVRGVASDRPVFPQIPDDMVLIAAAYIPAAMVTWAGVTDVAEYVSDKRLMLLSGAKGVADSSETFIRALNPITGNLGYEVRGDGTTIFSNGAQIRPEGSRRLRVSESLYADSLTGGTLEVDGFGRFGGPISANNFQRGSGTPTQVAETGTIYQDTVNGRVFVRNSAGAWDLLVPDGYPTGTIMPSILPSAHPWLKGMWLVCDGRSVSQQDAGNLWNLMPQWQDQGRFVLPDLRQRVLMGSDYIGVVGEYGGQNEMQMDTSHLPKHSHEVLMSTAGGHLHDSETEVSGSHGHVVNDSGHVHFPNWWPHPNTQFLSVEWGGKYAIPGRQTLWEIASRVLPNWPDVEPDKGTAVGQNPATLSATTGVQVRSGGDHKHRVRTNSEPPHVHDTIVSEEGSSSPVDNRQAYMTVNYFIKN